MTNAEAREIISLYNSLLDYDKKPLVFKPKPMRPLRWRFARTKKHHDQGLVTVEAMKRYIVHVCMFHFQ